MLSQRGSVVVVLRGTGQRLDVLQSLEGVEGRLFVTHQKSLCRNLARVFLMSWERGLKRLLHALELFDGPILEKLRQPVVIGVAEKAFRLAIEQRG